MSDVSTNTEKIRKLNDLLRTTGVGGKVMFTRCVSSLEDDERQKIISAVMGFDEFNEDNDPYGEHDFGSVTVCSYKIFWKIDYYDRDYKHGSEDPADPTQTGRVLTIMLAEEY